TATLLVEHGEDARRGSGDASGGVDRHDGPAATIASPHHEPEAGCNDEHGEEGDAEALAEGGPVDERGSDPHAARPPHHSTSSGRRAGTGSTSSTFAAVTGARRESA